MTRRPNIVLIMADNQPADMLGCYGNAEVHTPHLDRIAAAGTRFDSAFCVNAMCSPCRASVLTGLMPSAPASTPGLMTAVPTAGRRTGTQSANLRPAGPAGDSRI